MKEVSKAAKVGLFVLVTTGATFGIYSAVGKRLGNGKSYVVHALLDDATGLAAQSHVTVAGIPIGSIDAIKLEGNRARVNVRVNGDIALYDNATLGKKSSSLLGEFQVVITPGTEDHRKLHDGDAITIVTEQATGGQVMDEMKEIASQVKLVAQQLAKSVGTEQGGQNIRDTLKNLADATDALNKTIRENREYLNTTLKNVAGITSNANPQVATILENVRLVTEDVRALTKASPGPNGQVGELRETAERVNKAAKSLESALSHADHVAERIDKGEGTIGKLTKDETLINEVQGVAENVNDLVGGVTRVQTQVNLRSDYNFLSNTIKSYVEVRLQPREDKYYLIELINDPRGKTTFEQADVETTNPNEPARYRTVTSRTTDAFRFSLQFARRLGMFTGRFGIRESTGGVGLDMHLLSDKLEIRQDLFGFGEEIQPRYRLWIGYEFLNKLWLLGGVDHMFLSTRRDYFLGLQLRFTDDDLKYVLPFAGGLGK